MKKIFWIAGEKSGDLHASIVLENLQSLRSDLQHFGIGGRQMEKFGFNALFSFQRFSVMGFGEVLKHLSFFWKVEKKIEQILRTDPPDLVVLVDYPGLNLRIARLASKYKIPVLYFISPQFWAWKFNRIFSLKRFTDQIAHILPFEKSFFLEHKVNATYVGHPIVEEINLKLSKTEFAEKYKLSKQKTWLGFLPGSRDDELRKMLPVYTAAMSHFNSADYEFLISRADSVSQHLFAKLLSTSKKNRPRVIDDDRYEMIKHSDFMVVTSGTATIETAFLGTPFLIAYKTSFLSYLLGRFFIRIKRIGLPNIILNKDVIPELVQTKASGEKIADTIKSFLTSAESTEAMKTELQKIHALLEEKKCSQEVSKLILGLLNE